jgi:hypothetical protein
MWRFAAARVTGSSHLRTGTPGQDRFACVVLPDGALVAVMSDGAGSAPNADMGAEVAVQTALCQLRRDLGEGCPDVTSALRRAALSAREAVLSRALEDGQEAGSYASTLLALVQTAEGGAALQIGDGVIAVGRGGGDWSWMFWPERGEYANTTRFLTDDDAPDHIQVEACSGSLTDIAVMTDGLQPLALHYASQTVHEPFFRGMLQPLIESDGLGEVGYLSDSLEQFLSSDRVRMRTDDDLSLILATRRSPASPD